MNWTDGSDYARARSRKVRSLRDDTRRAWKVLVALLLFTAWLLWCRHSNAACFTSDVRTYCCPAACSVKKSNHWYQADEVLRGCMRGMGCQGSVKATVGMRCGC
jgi:hypothetical protein